MYFEEHNEAIDELIHPRSYRSDYGYVKPVSFLGMPLLYGKIGHLLGNKVIPYLTQFFAALSIIFFFLLIRRLFNQPIALISAFFLASFPVYIYYASRSMFHNIPFIAFLIIGLYFATVMVQMAHKIKTAEAEGKYLEKKLWIRNWSLIHAGLAGLFLGIATTMRTSELIWLGPLLLLLWLFNITRVGLAKLLLVLAFFTIAFVPVFYWNDIMYGAPLNTGYSELNQSVVNIASSSTEIVKSTVKQEFNKVPTLAEKLRDNFFFFGFKARHAIKMFYHYFYLMFGWLFWLAMAGGITFLSYWGFQRRQHWVYILVYFAIFPILLFYYGSWVFYDNPDPNSFTIGNSYTRYWLPLYLGVMPFAALAITAITKLIFRTKYLYNPIRVGIVLAVLLWSAWFVSYGSEEGLRPSLERHLANRTQYYEVLELTEPNAVIITTYHDKLFYPERKVIVAPITDYELNIRFAKAVKLMPVYYYSFTFPENDFNYLNSSLLRSTGLGIRPIKEITEDFTLYKLEERM
ncbi:MAG: glycosyltransferase family 39 protein, partial [bacterium]